MPTTPPSTATPTLPPPEETPTPAPSTPTPTPSPPAILSPIYLIGAAVIVILIIGGIVISGRRKGGTNNSPKPKHSTEPLKHGPELIKESPISEPVPVIKPALDEKSKIDITSAFGYKGATILYKIKVKNTTPEPISDIRVSLIIPDVFLLIDKEKHIPMLEPNESNTVTFAIRPTGECGDCNVSGRVHYYDYSTKKRKETDIETKSLSIVCPMLKSKEIDEPEWRSVVGRFAKAEENTKEIEIPAKALFEVTSDIFKDMDMFMLPPHVTETPQLYRATARFYAEGVKALKYAAQIEVVGGAKKSKLILKAWAEKEEALTGFYHGILDEIEKRIQVKGLIDDNIVQKFYHIGTFVKDSFVQRSTISGGAEAGKKCPRCGKDVSEDERFCPSCGEKLK